MFSLRKIPSDREALTARLRALLDDEPYYFQLTAGLARATVHRGNVAATYSGDGFSLALIRVDGLLALPLVARIKSLEANFWAVGRAELARLAEWMEGLPEDETLREFCQ